MVRLDRLFYIVSMCGLAFLLPPLRPRTRTPARPTFGADFGPFASTAGRGHSWRVANQRTHNRFSTFQSLFQWLKQPNLVWGKIMFVAVSHGQNSHVHYISWTRHSAKPYKFAWTSLNLHRQVCLEIHGKSWKELYSGLSYFYILCVASCRFVALSWQLVGFEEAELERQAQKLLGSTFLDQVVGGFFCCC